MRSQPPVVGKQWARLEIFDDHRTAKVDGGSARAVAWQGSERGRNAAQGFGDVRSRGESQLPTIMRRRLADEHYTCS